MVMGKKRTSQMTRWISVLVSLVFLSTPMGIFADHPEHTPQKHEVKVALQSMLVAVAASAAARELAPGLVFEEASFVSDSSLSSFTLTLHDADVGSMRRKVLERPAPPPRQMGFLEALFSAMMPVFPDYARMVAYLRPQALLDGEVVLTGQLEAVRFSTPYPFRYEGRGSMQVSGSRIEEPFFLDFSFVIPLEGPAGSAIIPIRVLANGIDHLAVARSLFRIPPGVDIESQLESIL